MQHRVLAGVVVAVVLSACGGGGADVAVPEGESPGGTADTGGDTASGGEEAETPGLSVTLPLEIVRDEAAGSESTIGSEGGSVGATASDGTVYTLTVPPNALADDTLIRAVPAVLPGLGASNWTVMFEPSGLEFLDFATLTIAPPTAVPVEQQVAFSIGDDGTEVGLALVDPESETLVVRVDHFSGYGLAMTTDRAWAAELGRQADRAERQLQSIMGEVLGQRRDEQLRGIDNSVETNQFVFEMFEQYKSDVVAPRLQAAGASCAGLRTAVQTVLGFERQVQMWGLGDSSLMDGVEGVGLDLAVNKVKPCDDEAVALCKESRSAGVLVRFRLGVERSRQLLGTQGVGFSLDDLIAEAKTTCRPLRYAATGGGQDITITGTISEIGTRFTLEGEFIGGTATFTYTPGADYRAGTLTYQGAGSGVTVSGEGTYTVSGEVGGVLTLQQTESGCTSLGGDTCRTTSETLTLTPIPD